MGGGIVDEPDASPAEPAENRSTGVVQSGMGSVLPASEHAVGLRGAHRDDDVELRSMDQQPSVPVEQAALATVTHAPAAQRATKLQSSSVDSVVDTLLPGALDVYPPVSAEATSKETPERVAQGAQFVSRSNWSERSEVLLRWMVLFVGVGFAYHETLVSVARKSYNHDPISYVLLLPLWAIVLALGTHFHRGDGLPIHDRQIDWTIAAWLGVIMLIVSSLLIPRLGAKESIARADIVAMLFFIIIGCVLLFGTRLTGRHWMTWLFLFLLWPFPYRVIGATAGGTYADYSLFNVALSALVVTFAVGNDRWTKLRAAAAVVVLGVAGVALFHHSGFIALVLLPAAGSLIAVTSVYWWRRRSDLLRTGAMATKAVKKPHPAMAAFLGVAVLLGLFVQLAPREIVSGSLPTAGTGWTNGPLHVEGWESTLTSRYSWPPQYFGPGAQWRRFRYASSASGTAAQSMVVDALTVRQTGPLASYPTITCYTLFAPSVESSALFDLGHGVEASMLYANSLEATSSVNGEWLMMTWIWRVPDTGHGEYQRMTVITLDGNTSRSGIPVPSPPTSSTNLGNTFSQVLRGTPSSEAPAPSPASISSLEAFARQIVAEQASPGGAPAAVTGKS